MAERRMFAKTIIDSDAFLDLPISAQALYFHLSMRADDDGFINKPRAIMNMIGARNEDAKVLCDNKFIIPFESGVVVIKHWRIHNTIKSDRYSATKYKFEKAQLFLDENRAYTTTEPKRNQSGTEVEPVWNQTGSEVEPQDRLVKDIVRIEEDKEGYINSLPLERGKGSGGNQTEEEKPPSFGPIKYDDSDFTGLGIPEETLSDLKELRNTAPGIYQTAIRKYRERVKHE